MTKILESLLTDFQLIMKTEAKVVDIGPAHQIEQLLDELQDSKEGLKEQFDDINPLFWYYLQILQFQAVFAEILLGHPLLVDFDKKLRGFEKKYSPGSPLSNICDSVFVSWRLLDAYFDEEGDTITSLSIKLQEEISETRPEYLDNLQNLSDSKMSFYECMGSKSNGEGGHFLLRELFTNNVYEVVSADSKFLGRERELVYARLFPALSSESSMLLMTVPYIIENVSEDHFLKFLKKRGIIQEKEGSLEKHHLFLKQGMKRMDYWLKYIRDKDLGFDDERECYHLDGYPGK